MGCGTSKEAVVSSDGSGRCSRRLFRRKSSVVATGAHQPVPAAAKDNGDGLKRHKAEAKAVVKGGGDVASTVIAAKIVGENKDKEEVKKDGKEEVAVAAGDAKGKETVSEKTASKADGVSDKEIVANQEGDVVVVEEIKNGEAAVEERRDERRGEGDEVWSGEAIDNEGASSTEKDIEEIAMEVDDDGGVAFTEAPVGVANMEDDGVVISAYAPATEEDEIVPYAAAPCTVTGGDGDVDVVAAPVAKEDELVSFASAPLAEEVDGIILPPTPVVEEVDVAASTAALDEEGQSAGFVDAPVAKENASVASIDASVAKEYERVTVAAAPAVTEDKGATTVDSAALTMTTANENETATSPAAVTEEDVEDVDESLAFAATAPVTDVEEAVEQPTVSSNDDDLRNDQEPPEPTAVEDVGRVADDETEQANEEDAVVVEEEVVTGEEVNAEPEEAKSVSRESDEEETSAAALRDDDGESDGQQTTDLDGAGNMEVEGGDDQLTVDAKEDDDNGEEPAVPPIEPPSS